MMLAGLATLIVKLCAIHGTSHQKHDSSLPVFIKDLWDSFEMLPDAGFDGIEILDWILFRSLKISL